MDPADHNHNEKIKGDFGELPTDIPLLSSPTLSSRAKAPDPPNRLWRPWRRTKRIVPFFEYQ
jgi:hypothetical protein